MMPVRAPGRRNLAAAVALGLALLLAGTLPQAAAHSPDPLLDGDLFAQYQLLRYRWTGAPPTALRTAVNAGAADANATRTSASPSFAYDSKGTSTVYYGTSVPCGVNGLACMRRYTPDSFGVWFRVNGHRFDWGTLRWCELSGSPDGCYEVENVTLDELGHVLILGHHQNNSDESDYLDAVVQTYSRAKPRAGWNAHAFGRCDVATLQQQYDLSPTTPYSTCLDVPTALGLAASRTSAPVGGSVTFTATLRADTSGRMGNNLISARVVVLQQRLATGWSDLVTMAAGSSTGTYTATVTVWGARDYRALFRKPSGEGLRASSSSAITVTAVSTCEPVLAGAPTAPCET
jgi:hypothetical protein